MSRRKGIFQIALLAATIHSAGITTGFAQAAATPDQGSDRTLERDADLNTGGTERTAQEAAETDVSRDGGLLMEEECLECECEGKITELTLRYLGSTSGFVEVYAGTEAKDEDRVFEGKIPLNGTFTFSGTLEQEGILGAEISIYVDSEINTNIDTSCANPIGSGLVSGDFEVVQGYSKIGGLLCPVSGPESDWCEDGKPLALTIRYTGQSCDASDHDQDERKSSCSGDPAGSTPVRVVASDRRRPSEHHAKIWFRGQVELNGTFSLDARNADERKLKAETYVRLSDLDGNVLQSVKFHTSCSQPLNKGDQFGSLLMVGFEPATP